MVVKLITNVFPWLADLDYAIHTNLLKGRDHNDTCGTDFEISDECFTDQFPMLAVGLR